MRVEPLVNSIFNSNSYVLTRADSSSVWVVDPGDVQPILERIADRQLVGILLTHTHFDHIYGLNGLLAAFPDAVIYTSVWGMEGLGCDKLNGSRYMEISFTVSHPHINAVGEGDSIELWHGLSAQVLSTPGHNRDCLSYYVPGDEVGCGHIFTGDALIPSIKVVAKGKYSDKCQVGVSIRKIVDRCSPDDLLCPGHNAQCLVEECHIVDLELF